LFTNTAQFQSQRT